MSQTSTTGIMSCYGRYRYKNDNCKVCDLSGFCRSATASDAAGASADAVNIEVIAAMEKYAELPKVYQTPCGKTGQTWRAMLKVLVFLTSLHPTTLRVLRCKMQNPSWQREEIAKAAGINVESIAKNNCQRIPMKKIFYTPSKDKKMKFTTADNVYLSGPMTGLADFNRPAFYDAEQRILERHQCNIISPAFTCNLMGNDRTHEHYMEVSLALVRTSSALVMLPGWSQSKGALMEHAEAERCNIPVFQLAEVVK